MKRVLLIATLFASAPVLADNYTRGYMRQDGTYVQPHYSSDPNRYRFDNYSSQGNTNPYTGQRGSRRNEFSDPPAYNKSHGGTYQNPYGSSSRRSRSGW